MARSVRKPEEARHYVSHEKLQCLICGKNNNSLGSHINRIHGLDETSYKEQFGIPYTVGLASAPIAKRHAEAYAKHISPEKRVCYLASARTSLQRQLDSGNFNGRQPVASVHNTRLQRIVAVNEAPACNRKCYSCGHVVSGRGAWVFYKGEMIRREECLAPTSRRPPYKMSLDDREKLQQWGRG